MDALRTDRRRTARAEDAERRGRRVEPRAHLRLPVSVETLHGKTRTGLLEVSLSGARLEGPGLPPVGKDILLMCGEVEAFGRIVWAAGERCGMQFDEPITVAELVALRQVAVAIEHSGITREEMEAIGDWESGLAR